MATYHSLLAYWSGGAVQPPLTANTSLIEVFKSYTGKIPDAYFGAYTLCATQDGKLLAGLGNRPADTDGALIVEILPDGSAKAEKILDEQGVHEMRLFNGKVYVLGSDAMDDWTFGNVYVRDEFGNWAKKRTLPNVIHAFSQAWIGSYWYVGTGAHTGDNTTWTGLVFKSNNDGNSWTQLSSPVCDYRVYNLGYKNNTLYAGGMTQSLYFENYGNAYIYTSANDGASWINTGIKICARPRWFDFKGRYVTCNPVGDTLITISDTGTIEQFELPFTLKIMSYEYNIFASNGVNIFVLGTDGIYASSDLISWAKFDEANNRISMFYYLYIMATSNSGSNPSALFINIPGNDISHNVYVVSRLYNALSDNILVNTSIELSLESIGISNFYKQAQDNVISNGDSLLLSDSISSINSFDSVPNSIAATNSANHYSEDVITTVRKPRQR